MRLLRMGPRGGSLKPALYLCETSFQRHCPPARDRSHEVHETNDVHESLFREVSLWIDPRNDTELIERNGENQFHRHVEAHVLRSRSIR